jgi:hypothetical protein
MRFGVVGVTEGQLTIVVVWIITGIVGACAPAAARPRTAAGEPTSTGRPRRLRAGPQVWRTIVPLPYFGDNELRNVLMYGAGGIAAWQVLDK